MINLPERSFVLLGGFFGVAFTTLSLILGGLGGRVPELPRLAGPTGPTVLASGSPTLTAIFAPETLRSLRLTTNTVDVFYTAYFEPPPPAPPKRTRKVALSYQGFFQTTFGERRAYVLVGTNLVISGLGGKVVADLTVTNIALGALTLQHSSTQQTVLPFRATKEMEVPIE